jgi:apolipoprotein N-acyltransferase
VASVFRLRGAGVGLTAVGLTAILVWFGTGLEPLWPLLWIAPLPILLIALHSSLPGAFLVALAAWLLGSLNMWHYFHGVLRAPYPALIAIFLGAALIFAIAVLIFRALARRGRYWSALFAFPAAWVSFEYLINVSSPHGTAASLAYSQLKFLPILQLASVTGPWGISFAVLLFPAALALALSLRRNDRAAALRLCASGVGLVFLAAGFGAIRLAAPASSSHVKVGLITSDLRHNVDIAHEGADTQRLLHDYAAEADKLAARGAQVVVLPEKLGVVVGADADAIDREFQAIADRTRASIVVGVLDVLATAKFNRARIFVPESATLTYDKHHMLPPFESQLKPGTALTLLTRPQAPWGVEICKDMDFTALSRQYGAAGVALMLVPAWDFDLDRTWHGHIALMRGVESGFSIARAAKQGYLTVSDDRGRVIAEARSDAAPYVALIADTPAKHDATIYILGGDWFAWLAILVLAAALARIFFSPVRAPAPEPTRRR